MITYTVSDTKADLEGILALQRANLPGALAPGEKLSQGFVTVAHRYEDLAHLNHIEKHTVAKEGDRVVAYLLAMTAQSRAVVPVLVPMFEMFDAVTFKGRPVSQYDYLVVGQVCVDKDYRGRQVLDNCYAAYRERFSGRYAFAITEIDSANPRSLRAHARIGFREVARFVSSENTEWCIVLWDWKTTAAS